MVCGCAGDVVSGGDGWLACSANHDAHDALRPAMAVACRSSCAFCSTLRRSMLVLYRGGGLTVSQARGEGVTKGEGGS
eukprot:scaffold35640_cov101-Isochrysis_galbana.AAC.1